MRVAYYLTLKKLHMNIKAHLHSFFHSKTKLYIFISIIIALSYSLLKPVNSKSELDFRSIETTLSYKNSTEEKQKSSFSIYSPDSLSTATFETSKNIKLYFKCKAPKENKNKTRLSITYKDEECDIFEIESGKKERFILNVNQNDPISFSVSSSHPENSINITVYERTPYLLFKKIIPILLWICFLVFIFRRKYLISGIQAYCLFFLFILAEKMQYGEVQFQTVLLYCVLSFFWAYFSIVLYNLSASSRINKFVAALSSVLYVLLSAIPVLFIFYQLRFNVAVSELTFYAIYQTSFNETIEFLSNQLAIIAVIVIIASIVLTYFLCHKESKNSAKEPFKQNILILFLLGVIVFSFNNHYKTIALFTDTYSQYYAELDAFRRVQEKRKAGKVAIDATKEETGETYIVVIGESHNKRNMGLYGYHRNTTPYLSALDSTGELVVFNNAFSNHTHTVQTLSLALTESNQINKKEFYKSPSIVEILNQANFETYWLSNQALKSKWSNLVSAIAEESDHVLALNKDIGTNTREQHFDEILVENLQTILKEKNKKNRIIFLHLSGNHALYFRRYPQHFLNYKNNLPIGDFGALALTENIAGRTNTYDNSILYNDYVVSSLIEATKQSNSVSALIYFADHSEDVVTGYEHNADKFTFEMVNIPLFLWLSDSYKNTYSSKAEAIYNNKEKLVPNDLIYDAIIGIAGVKTPHTKESLSIGSPQYHIDEADAKTLHSCKNITAEDNHIWWQKKSSNYIHKHNLAKRIVPQQTNTKGALKEIWSQGYRSFKVDVYYDADSAILYTGHGKEKQCKKFYVLLSSVPVHKTQKIWLDIKNINNSNYKEIIAELEQIDSIYNIKDKVILESKSQENFISEISAKGWHTSYYLPDSQILNLIKGNKTTKLKTIAQSISSQIRKQKLQAVSFDSRIYSFVTTYLAPIIPQEAEYHIWMGPNLWSNRFEKELTSLPTFKDERVKTILCAYKSPYRY